MNSLIHLFIYIAALLLISLPSSARKVSLNEARTLASEFLNRSKENINLKQQKASTLKNVPLNNQINAYLFLNETNHFILVAGTDNLPPILGYGETNEKSIHRGFSSLANSLSSATYNPTLMNNERKEISNLLHSIRSQKEPFNIKCPIDTASGKHCMVGCVATAFEQVFNYYKYPQKLQQTIYSWDTCPYKLDSIPRGTPIDFDYILDVYRENEYTQQNAEAVANLSYYLGLALQMDWGESESGAQLYNIQPYIHTAFGYRYYRWLSFLDYTPQRWHELLDNELNEGRPVIYCGTTSLYQGHAFVIDGRDSEGYYHVNWGYNGNYDGFYNLAILNAFENPQESTDNSPWLGFSINQQMVFLNPDTIAWNNNDKLNVSNDITLDSIIFARKPDLSYYVPIQVYATNKAPVNRQVDISFYTFAPEDIELEGTMEYVACSTLQLAPNASGTTTTYAQFKNSGKRRLIVLANYRNIILNDTISVSPANGQLVEIDHIDTTWTKKGIVFFVKIRNISNTDYAGSMLTYSMFEGEYTTNGGEWRKWDVLNLPPLASQTDTLIYNHLKPNTRYTFVIRRPWLPYKQFEFVTPTNPTNITSIPYTPQPTKYYTIEGAPLSEITRTGIYLIYKEGKYQKNYIQKP